MAIPVEPGTMPPVVVGDLVEVLVALGPDASGGGPVSSGGVASLPTAFCTMVHAGCEAVARSGGQQRSLLF